MNPKIILIIILVFAFITRIIRIDYPNQYVFDEVYHGFTAKEYLKGNKEAWNPWADPPKGVGYEWLHPPIAKEIMAFSMLITKSQDPWAWRLPAAIMGILAIYLTYLLGRELFKSVRVGLLSAFIFSIDGLNFVQSRIGMNDIYLVAFVLLSLLLFIKNKYFWSAIFLGVAISTKWPGIFMLPIYALLIFHQRQFVKLIYFILIPPIIYLLSYLQYFLLGYNLNDFIKLHQQIWWYQTHLKATHDYASPWWSWPFNFYPVWYFVEYQGNKLANIFATGNPLVFWVGVSAIILTILEFIKTKSKKLLIILAGFFVFWLPWAFSPRIMFLYHFSPAVPFLSLALGYQLEQILKVKKNYSFVIAFLIFMFVCFLLLFPLLTGIPLSENFLQIFFYTNLTKDPF